MTKYEALINKSKDCYKKAITTNDENLQKFYKNASVGFRIKAAKLTIKEAGEEAK